MEWLSPPAVCTLPTVDQPLRVAEFDALLTDHLVGCDRVDATTLDLAFRDQPGLDAVIDDLAARESACCSFFSFVLRREGGGLLLRVTVPGAYVGVLDGLQGLAHRPARPLGGDR